MRKYSREYYHHEGKRIEIVSATMDEETGQPILPPLHFWTQKHQRHNVKWTIQGYTEVGKFKLKAPVREWLDYNMRDGYEVVRVVWWPRQSRFAIRVNSDRDAVVYRLFQE